MTPPGGHEGADPALPGADTSSCKQVVCQPAGVPAMSSRCKRPASGSWAKPTKVRGLRPRPARSRRSQPPRGGDPAFAKLDSFAPTFGGTKRGPPRVSPRRRTPKRGLLRVSPRRRTPEPSPPRISPRRRTPKPGLSGSRLAAERRNAAISTSRLARTRRDEASGERRPASSPRFGRPSSPRPASSLRFGRPSSRRPSFSPRVAADQDVTMRRSSPAGSPADGLSR